MVQIEFNYFQLKIPIQGNLEDLFQRTYIRDIVDRHNLRGEIVLDTLVDILASSVGSLNNPNKIAKTFVSNKIKASDKTISLYIDYLLDSFLIRKAQRYDIKGRRYIDSPFKYYFSDIGLRNARLKFRQQEQTHIMENILFNELIVRGFSVDVGIVETYKRTEDGKQEEKQLEVDFVCNKGNMRYYIQSAFSMPTTEKKEQEQAALDGIDDSFKKIIITQDIARPWRNEKGYLIINIIDFLLDPNSLELWLINYLIIEDKKNDMHLLVVQQLGCISIKEGSQKLDLGYIEPKFSYLCVD